MVSFGYLLAASAAEYLSISKSHPKAEGVGEHLQCIWPESGLQCRKDKTDHPQVTVSCAYISAMMLLQFIASLFVCASLSKG